MSNRKLNGFFAYVLLAVVLCGCNSNYKPVPKTQDQIKKDSIEYWETLHRISGII